jgi:hypothetical protein
MKKRRTTAKEKKKESKRQILTKKWHFLVFTAVSLVRPVVTSRSS